MQRVSGPIPHGGLVKTVHSCLPASRSGSSLLIAHLRTALEGHELSSCSLASPPEQSCTEFCRILQALVQATVRRGVDCQEAVDCWMPLTLHVRT